MRSGCPSKWNMAYNCGAIGLHARIRCAYEGKCIETTAGRVMFNQIMPRKAMGSSTRS